MPLIDFKTVLGKPQYGYINAEKVFIGEHDINNSASVPDYIRYTGVVFDGLKIIDIDKDLFWREKECLFKALPKIMYSMYPKEALNEYQDTVQTRIDAENEAKKPPVVQTSVESLAEKIHLAAARKYA